MELRSVFCKNRCKDNHFISKNTIFAPNSNEMKKKLAIFSAFVLFFVVLTIIFMFAYANLFSQYSFGERMMAVLYSLPQHLSVASWIMLPAFAVGIIYVFIRGDWHRHFMVWYITLAFIPVLLLNCIDMVLYGFWGFRLDTTPLVYILDDPMAALAESPVWAPFASTVLILFFAWLIYKVMGMVYPPRRRGASSRMSRGAEQVREGWLNVALTLGCWVLAWGGVGEYSYGMGSAYHTDQMVLNHASTNPVYSFFHSLRQQRTPLSEQYRFMSDAEAAQAFSELESGVLNFDPASAVDSLALNADSLVSLSDSLVADPSEPQALLKVAHPNILLILFESFSGSACHYLYPEADENIMPNFCQAMREGVAFTRFYANSFRTERGMVSVLSAYPGQPTFTLMTDTLRTAKLPFLSSALFSQGGYDPQFIHGGDATFCGLTQYMHHGGVTDIIGKERFPAEQQECQWGVHDDKMFDFVHKEMSNSQNFFKVFLTLSSHEPFEVPYSQFPDDPYLNSVAYTDHCFGQFIDQVKADTALWNNLLIIGMPDHCYAQYPAGVQQHDPLRYHIPMFWTGGAVNGHQEVATLGQQTDLAATLLAQLGYDSSVFTYSHDLLDPSAPHYAFYAWPDGFGLLGGTASYVQDNNYDGHPLQGSNDTEGKAERMGKAFLQKLYDDLGKK